MSESGDRLVTPHQVFRWAAAGGVAVALLYLLLALLTDVLSSGRIDRQIAAAFALCVPAVRTLYLFLRRFENAWLHLANLAGSLLPGVAAYAMFFGWDPGLVAVLGLAALVLIVYTLTIDALGRQKAVWMWQAASW